MIDYSRWNKVMSEESGDQEWWRSILSNRTVEDKILPQIKSDETSKSKVKSLNVVNKVIDKATPWTTLLHLAASETQTQGTGTTRQSYGARRSMSFTSPILQAAHRKAVARAASATGFSAESVDRTVTKKWSESRMQGRNTETCVRWFRDLPEAWFSECDECAGENDLPWENCVHCGASRED